MNKHLPTFSLIAFMIALTSGCASMGKSPSFAEQLQSEGARAAELAANWEEGQELVNDGEDKIRAAEKRIRDGQKLVLRGEAMIDEGNQHLALQKQAYINASAKMGLAINATQVKTEVTALKGIAGHWSDAEEDVLRGQKLVKEGQEKLAKGRTENQQGEQMVTRGRAMMMDAEAAYSGKSSLLSSR